MSTDLTVLQDPRDAGGTGIGPGSGSGVGAAPGRDRSARSGFLRYLARKVAVAVGSLAFTIVVGFVIFTKMPADPVHSLTRGRPVSPAQLEQLKEELGVGLPVWQQFLHFAAQVLHGQLGYSYQFNQPVASLIAERIGPTLLLTGSATVISVVLGLWLGVRSGWRAGSAFDRVASGVSLTLWSVPTFWLGLILLILATGAFTGVFPAGGYQTAAAGYTGIEHVLDVARHLVLPCLTLVLVVFAQYVTIMRSSIIDELGNPYLLTARAKGLRDDDVRRRHAVPNALLPSVTIIFLQLGGVIGGAITVEVVYSYPGLGYLTFQALKIPDIQLLEGTFLIFSASVIIFNLLADVLYRFLDPRVRAQ